MGLHEWKGIGDMSFIDTTMNASLDTQILNENMRPSPEKLEGKGFFEHWIF